MGLFVKNNVGANLIKIGTRSSIVLYIIKQKLSYLIKQKLSYFQDLLQIINR